ncbi:MAG: DUF2971 domain-containing protein [Cellvibrionaceae bacterium]
MIQKIAQSLYSDTPEELLYHYTTISGLKGIVESQSIWASDVRYMNDSAELQYIISLLKDCSESFQHHKKFLNQFIDWMSHRVANGHMVFAISFRANGNLLSQWRGYSQIGKGVSIGFKTEDIVSLAKPRGFQLGACIYQRDKQVALINDVIENLLHIAQGRELNVALADFDSLFNQIEADMLKIAALLKHPSFVEEDEWRLVSPAITDYLGEPVHFREGTSMMIPYYQFPLVDNQLLKEQNAIPVKHVFVGPTPNSTLSLNSIALYLKQHGVDLGNTISYCDIPYRSK